MISVVTPTLNCAAKLTRTISSLDSQSAVFEHIIQDGGSSDGTLEVADTTNSHHAVLVARERDAGHYDAIRRGFEKANGDVLCWLNAGDVYAPWAFGVVERLFQHYPQVEWITGIPASFVNEPSAVWIVPYAPVYPRRLIAAGYYRAGRLGFLQQESMFWRRDLWRKANGPRVLTQYKYAADFHLWRSFGREAQLYTTPTVLGCFGYESDQFSDRFRGEYLRECGAKVETMTASRLGRMINRGTSLLLRRRLVRPLFDGTDWEWRAPKWL